MFQEGRRIDKMTARSKRRGWYISYIYCGIIIPSAGKKDISNFFLYEMDAEAGTCFQLY